MSSRQCGRSPFQLVRFTSALAISKSACVESGKETALPPSPPLRTGRESFPSSGSSRYKAPRERNRFTRRLQFRLGTMNTKPSEERTVFKVVAPLRVKGIGISLDFDVPPDSGFAGIYQL
jgi:hypothetical protein